MDILGRLEPWDYGFPTSVTLEYPDGTSYTVDSTLLLWVSDTQNGEVCQRMLFPAPQPIQKASAVVLCGVRISLK